MSGQTDIKSALRKIKVVFQQPKFEVVFQIRVYLNKIQIKIAKQAICKTMPQTDLQVALKTIWVVFQQPNLRSSTKLEFI